MQPRDAVKLLYQNEFGGGHLIVDEAASLERLRAEYAAVQRDASQPLFEQIGNGFCRVNLAALDARTYPLARLHTDFLRSAAQAWGSMDGFSEKLAVLLEAADTLPFAFCRAELETYLTEYTGMGCPPVSHSEVYRAAYRPAYRVLCP